MSLESYKELVVWQKSMDLVEQIYRLAQRLPKAELYGLRSQKSGVRSQGSEVRG